MEELRRAEWNRPRRPRTKVARLPWGKAFSFTSHFYVKIRTEGLLEIVMFSSLLNQGVFRQFFDASFSMSRQSLLIVVVASFVPRGVVASGIGGN